MNTKHGPDGSMEDDDGYDVVDMILNVDMMLLIFLKDYHDSIEYLWMKVKTEHCPDGAMEEANLEVKEHLLHVVGLHPSLLDHCGCHGQGKGQG